MTEMLANLGLGFSTVWKIAWMTDPLMGMAWPVPINLLLCFIGCLVGTLIGVLPGVGPIATIAMLLPITFGLDPIGALIMLAGIYYGAQYGGSTTAILVNIPGEASSVVTTLDGHEMARQGRAGIALGIAAIGSFFAGTVATVIIAALGAPLTKLALVFGPAEYLKDANGVEVTPKVVVRVPVQIVVRIGNNEVRLSGASGPRRAALE